MTTMDRYAELLNIHRPALPKTAREHEGMVQLLESLAANEKAQPEEVERFIDLLRTLVLAYEAEAVQIPDATGIDILKHLMEERGLRQTDLVPGLGSKSYVSQLFTGHRSISSTVAAQLARFFQVEAASFLPAQNSNQLTSTELRKVLEREIKRQASATITIEISILPKLFLCPATDIELVLAEMQRAGELELTRYHKPSSSFLPFDAWPSAEEFFDLSEQMGDSVIRIRINSAAAGRRAMHA